MLDKKITKPGLYELSPLYYKNSRTYYDFSEAQDHPDLIWSYLASKIKGTVLDLGCGNGKYLKKLQESGHFAIGADLSLHQLKIAQQAECKHLVLADAATLSFSRKVDQVFSFWVWGTIPENKRSYVLDNVLNMLKESGELFLIENAQGSEFEILRGHQGIGNQSEKYDNWLTLTGFELIKTIDTYFLFESAEKASKIFKKIWGDRLTSLRIDAKIEQSVNIWVKKFK